MRGDRGKSTGGSQNKMLSARRMITREEQITYERTIDLQRQMRSSKGRSQCKREGIEKPIIRQKKGTLKHDEEERIAI